MNWLCTIIIPCYNEGKRFPMARFTAYVAKHPDIRFLLVNDGSRDDTLAVLTLASKGRENQVEVLDQRVNQGKGEAVRIGMLRAMEEDGCVLAGFWDADLATPLETITEMADLLLARSELRMIFGARVKLLGRHVARRAMRHYLGRVFATVVSSILRLAIYDTQCGAKLFRASPEMKELFAETFSSRWIFDVELLARFIRQNDYEIERVESAIYEFPLSEWTDVAGSRVRPMDFVRAFFDVVQIHFRYRK